MGRLAAQMPGLAQLLSPPSATVVSINPTIGTSPTSLAFAATQGGSNPATQTLSISNTGGGTLTWSASDNAAWLTLSPASGTGNGTVTLTAATGTLSAGSYSGTVTMSATGVTPVTVPVTFTVATAPNISLNPSSLTYAATQGAANPTNQTVSLTTTGGTLNWTVTDTASWLTVSPASGSSNSSTLTASVNTAGLAAGPHTGTITVSATGASSKTVAVTLTLNIPTTSSAAVAWSPNTEPDLASYRIYRSTTPGVYGAAVATVPASTISSVVTGLQIGNTYYFTITAVDAAGNESTRSNEVSKSIF